MNVLITGGTGFIGSRLAEHCLARGDRVTVLGQTNTEAEAKNVLRLRSAGATIVNGSVTDLAAIAEASMGQTVIFHLAATQHEMNVPDQRFRDVNVTGTRNVFEAAVRSGVSRVVHGSTIGVYGTASGVIDEATPTAPDNIYGVTKLQGEEVALGFADRIPVVVIRIPEIYGPGDRRLLKLFRAIEKNRFVMIGSGQNLHQPLYIDDLVSALVAASTSQRAIGKVVLLAGKEAITTRQMSADIGEALGQKAYRFTIPMLPMRMAATVMELTLRPLGVQPPLHRRRLDFFRKSLSFRSSRSNELLGFAPETTFREGARQTAAWYRSQSLLGGGVSPSGATGAIAPGKDIDLNLTAKIEPFDSFWEAPTNIEKGYWSFATFYRHNYLRFVPAPRETRILVTSCGPGYFVSLLRDEGYTAVLGIDSFPEKVAHAAGRGLNCEARRAFGFLQDNREPFDCIIAEQELNHLTKDEILGFLRLVRDNLRPGGQLIAHAINGAHPIVGSESRWGNFDHYNAWTDYSLHQVMAFAGLERVKVFDLKLYVFFTNPLNYVALVWDTALRLFFRVAFKMVGKSNTLFSKKIGVVGTKPMGEGQS